MEDAQETALVRNNLPCKYLRHHPGLNSDKYIGLLFGIIIIAVTTGTVQGQYQGTHVADSGQEKHEYVIEQWSCWKALQFDSEHHDGAIGVSCSACRHQQH